ncbi:HNH endonuclease [Leucobacter albus]|uniref:HNH endonuclease n=2 Tax=Leucobacter albus TaxID=272210 RepID=A0ABW3TUZ3_9MICO
MFGTRLVHRVSLMLQLGRTLEGDVMHHCDNPPCLRPNHLRESTHQENMLDAAAKGRMFAPRAGQAKCKHGHELTPLTTVKYLRPDGYNETRCVECRRNQNKTLAARRKQERHARGLKRRRTI